MRVLRIALFALMTPVPARAQTPTWTSYLKARAELDSAVAAIGGAEALRALKDVSREMSAIRTDIGQGPRPARREPVYAGIGQMPPKSTAPRVVSIRDYAGGRAYDHVRDTIYGGGILDVANVVAPPARFSAYYDYISNGVRTSNPAALPFQRAAAFRRYPEGILRAALARIDAVRWIGEAEFDGRKQRVIHFGDADGAQLSLYFDARTHLLTKTETIGDDPLRGDASFETVFLDYRPVGALKFPFRYLDRVAGFTLQDNRATSLVVDTRPADSLFVKPSFAEVPPAVVGPELEKLSDNAAVVWGSDYNSLVYALADEIIVVEAGVSSGYASAALGKIKAAFPGKPIRHLIVTHWNMDHLAGVRPYVAEGAVFVTTPMVKTALEGLWTNKHTLRPDALSAAPHAPTYELVTSGTRTFGDGGLEIHDLSPNPHVDEMLVVYLPREKVLFEADLFDLPVKGHEPTGGADTEFLLDWIERSKLDVQKIVPVHGVAATMEDLRKSVARRNGSR